MQLSLFTIIVLAITPFVPAVLGNPAPRWNIGNKGAVSTSETTTAEDKKSWPSYDKGKSTYDDKATYDEDEGYDTTYEDDDVTSAEEPSYYDKTGKNDKDWKQNEHKQQNKDDWKHKGKDDWKHKGKDDWKHKGKDDWKHKGKDDWKHKQPKHKDEGWSVSVSVDPRFDQEGGSLWNSACSNGQHGLVDEYPTFGDIPRFPYLGAFPGIKWNSPNCGACYQVTYKGRHVYVTGVDSAWSPILSKHAFDDLTNWKTDKLGGYIQHASYKQVPSHKCY